MPLIQDAVLHNVNYTAFRSHKSWCKLIIHFKSFPCEALCALSVSSGDESSPGGGGEAQRDSPASGRVCRFAVQAVAPRYKDKAMGRSHFLQLI